MSVFAVLDDFTTDKLLYNKGDQLTVSGNVSDDDILDWISNNAHWWSQDLITEDEFIHSLQYILYKKASSQ